MMVETGCRAMVLLTVILAVADGRRRAEQGGRYPKRSEDMSMESVLNKEDLYQAMEQLELIHKKIVELKTELDNYMLLKEGGKAKVDKDAGSSSGGSYLDIISDESKTSSPDQDNSKVGLELAKILSKGKESREDNSLVEKSSDRVQSKKLFIDPQPRSADDTDKVFKRVLIKYLATHMNN